MFCTRCGTNSPEGAMFCSGCGAELPRGGVPAATAGTTPAATAGEDQPPPPIPAQPRPAPGAYGTAPAYGAPPPAYGAPPVYGAAYGTMPGVQTGPQYAGFWLRVVALFIDNMVMAPVAFIGVAILGGTIFANLARLQPGETPDPALIMTLVSAYGGMILLIVFANFLYFSLMESSRHQATLGKKAMGLLVTDLNGQRLTFSRAAGRYFAKIITHFTFGIGYAMAGFTEKRQCLHDMIAGCLVIRK